MEDPGLVRSIISSLDDPTCSLPEVLNTLSEILTFADELPLDCVCDPHLIGTLCKKLAHSNDTATLLPLLRCMVPLIHHEMAGLFLCLHDNFCARLGSILASTDSADVAEAELQLISAMIDKRPRNVIEAIDITRFFSFLPTFSRIDQRSCLRLMEKVTDHAVHPVWADHITDLLPWIRSDDTATRHAALSTFCSVAMGLPVEQMRPDTAQYAIDMINSDETDDVVRRLLGVIEQLSKRPDIVKVLIDRPLDFKKLLIDRQDSGIVEHALIVMERIFPENKLPACLWETPPAVRRDAVPFVSGIVPIMITLLMRNTKSDRMALKILAASSTIVTVEPNEELLMMFLKLAGRPGNVSFVLAIVERMQDKTMVCRTGLFHALQQATIPANQREWGQHVLHDLKRKCDGLKRKIPREVSKAKDLNTILAYLEKENVRPFELWDSDLLEKCCVLLSKMKRGDCGDLRRLEALANEMLDYFSIEKKRTKGEIVAFRRATVKFVLKGPGGDLGKCSFPIFADFSCVEGWYNLQYSPGIRDNFLATVSDDPFLKSMMDFENVFASAPVFSVLARAFKVDGYKKCSFKVDGKQFSVFDSFTDMMRFSLAKERKLQRRKFNVEIIETDVSRVPFSIHRFEDPKCLPVLKVLKEILRCAPEQFHYNEHFVSLVSSRLTDPLEALTLRSPAVQLVYSFRELFPFRLRLDVFKMTGLDPVNGVNAICDHVEAHITPKLELPAIRFSVSREGLFEKACFLLGRIGAGKFRFQFSFQDEPGFGEGPLQEFFTCLCHDFCKRDLKLWRDNFLVESQFAVYDGGLFPAVTADNGLLQILGFLCGKALLLDKVISIPFHPMFFKMVCGGKVKLKDVDPVLAKSLSVKEGLYDLPFVYPGTNVELKRGGADIEVTARNVNEYISLIESFTCGPVMANKISYFVKAFETCVHVEALKLFSYDEIVTAICGSEPKLTIEDLRKYVKLEHGYDSNSPEITSLFEIISEMNADEQRLFVKFVTGSQRLPFGGLEFLKPPLTIARRVDATAMEDECLPSVMTCTNYFKLPAYSSKEIMKTKILQAIYECQDTFQLS